MPNGNGHGFISWQVVGMASAALVGSAALLYISNNVSHLDMLDKALGDQTAGFNRMTGAMDNLTASNNRIQDSLKDLYERLHIAETSGANALAQIVSDQHDIAALRVDFDREKNYDDSRFESMETKRPGGPK
jgi:hypothetical protein